MKQIHSKEEMLDIIQTGKLSVFLFSANWCGDCLFIKPFLPEIEKKYSMFDFYLIDRDECLDLAIELEIMGIPSFVAYKNKVEVSRFVSSLRKTKDEIMDYLDKTLEREDVSC